MARKSALKKFVVRARRAARRNTPAKVTRARNRFSRRSGRRHKRTVAVSRGPKLLGIDLMSVGKNAVLGGVGAIGTGLGTNLIAQRIPDARFQSGAGKLAVRAGITIALSMLARKAVPAKIAVPVIAGAWVGLGIDVLNTFVMPSLKTTGALGALHGYESPEEIAELLEVSRPDGMGSLVGVSTVSPYASLAGSGAI